VSPDGDEPGDQRRHGPVQALDQRPTCMPTHTR
jgi:hypothetical protein